MEVVTGAMSTLLPKLGDLLKEEYKLQKNVRGEIMFLTAELESMQAALLKISDAPIDQPPDIQVKLWARDVRELSYDIEDSIDTFVVRIDTPVPTNQHIFKDFLERSIKLLTKAKIRQKIGNDIEDIKRKVKEVSERRDRYKVDNVAAKPFGPTIDSLRLSPLYKKVTELVAIDKRCEELVERLMEGDATSNGQLKIVSIVGFGGLGKTTLANVVYPKLYDQFHCGAFVSVSLNPNMEKIFKNILHQLDPKEYVNINETTWGEALLIGELRKFLHDKRYFIVIDDVWDGPVWETIRYALVENKYGSKVITTTRVLGVAKQADSVYELEHFSPQDSRKLFYQRIFGSENCCPPSQLVEVSENILRKCGGVPLAIITIASMLATKKEKKDVYRYWLEVYRSIGSGLEDIHDLKNMRRILSIGYHDLPPHLKTCFLYLSVYPEDSIITKDDLIWKWIGEGFVQQELGKSLYEVGEDYFNELINKSLIQAEVIDNSTLFFDNSQRSMTRAVEFEYGTILSCRIHDMMLDMITSLSNDDNFISILVSQQPKYVRSKIRRLSVQNCMEESIKQMSTMSLSQVRSLTVFKQGFCCLPALSSLPLLRSLDLRKCKQVDDRYYKFICNMFHLRCLILYGTSISKIPEEISNLQFLQVLDIRWTDIIELPPTIVRLQQLVCLRTDSLSRLPYGFGNWKSLQEYQSTLYINSTSMLYDLGKLSKLRYLKVCVDDQWSKNYEKPLVHCLSNLVSLETLIVTGYYARQYFKACDYVSLWPEQLRSIKIGSMAFSAVPIWMSKISSLSSLKMTLRTLRHGDLEVLGSMPSLSDLSIEVHEVERLVIDNSYPFHCLTRFSISNIAPLVFAQGAMRNLQFFAFRFQVREAINQYGDFDFGLENLSSLNYVYAEINYQTTKDELVMEAAKAAICKALEMNPNKPSFQLEN